MAVERMAKNKMETNLRLISKTKRNHIVMKWEMSIFLSIYKKLIHKHSLRTAVNYNIRREVKIWNKLICNNNSYNKKCFMFQKINLPNE